MPPRPSSWRISYPGTVGKLDSSIADWSMATPASSPPSWYPQGHVLTADALIRLQLVHFPFPADEPEISPALAHETVALPRGPEKDLGRSRLPVKLLHG